MNVAGDDIWLSGVLEERYFGEHFEGLQGGGLYRSMVEYWQFFGSPCLFDAQLTLQVSSVLIVSNFARLLRSDRLDSFDTKTYPKSTLIAINSMPTSRQSLCRFLTDPPRPSLFPLLDSPPQTRDFSLPPLVVNPTPHWAYRSCHRGRVVIGDYK